MIDDPIKTEHLLERLKAQLPFNAILRPSLLATLRMQTEPRDWPTRGAVAELHYAGDEGGIMCAVTFDAADARLHTPITHLQFDRRMPLAREITAYQKHRIKRLRREQNKI